FGADAVTTGPGNDIILGGAGTDNINAADGNNVVAGDFAQIDMYDSRLSKFVSLDAGSGHGDVIQVGNGNDTVIANDGADQVTASGGNNLLIGDHAMLMYHANGELQKVESTSPTAGDIDTILSGFGQDLVIAGHDSDSITIAGGDNIVIGDNGEMIFDDTTILRELRNATPTDGGSDTISTGSGNDTLLSGNGADQITIAGGNNIVVGDNGQAIYDSTGTLRILNTTNAGVGGNGSITTGSGNDTVFGGAGKDNIGTSGGNNLLIGDSGTATFDSAGRIENISTTDASIGDADTISSGDGNDIILSGAAGDHVDAGNGNNLIVGDNGSAGFSTNGNVSHMTSTDNSVGGRDTIHAGSGNDLVLGGVDNDTITNVAGNNVVAADNADVLFRNDGTLQQLQSETVEFAGTDSVTTGSGSDVVLGGSGSDNLTTSGGDNLIVGDNGLLIFDAIGIWMTVESTATDTGGDETINSGSGHDHVIAGFGNDAVTTTGGDNVIFGDNAKLQSLPTERRYETTAPTHGGTDSIHAGDGHDVIFAGASADTVNAGNGNNIVFGDHGFALLTPTSDIVDLQSTDFEIGGVDQITTGIGRDYIFAGTASDSADAGHGSNVVFGDLGRVQQNSNTLQTISSLAPSIGDDDTITAGNGTTVAVGGFGADQITTGDGNNTAVGDNGLITRNDLDHLLTATTTSPAIGDEDIVNIGTGVGAVLGGAADDSITAAGGRNLLLGDHGAVTFNGAGIWLTVTSENTGSGGDDSITAGSGSDFAIGGFGQDTITLNDGANVALGDNGSATFDAAGQLRTMQTIDAHIGDEDVIRTGVDIDIVLAGNAKDNIDVSDGRNVVFGDHGFILVNDAGQWTDIVSTDFTQGNYDLINTGGDDDVVVGGLGADTITAVNGKNLIAGDHAQATFNAAGFLLATATLSPVDGAADSITSGIGSDIVLGGAANDDINVSDGRNIVFGDHGEIEFDGLGQWLNVTTIDVAIGGDDTIQTGNHNDIIFGGFAQDSLTAANGDNTVVGDNGTATFDPNGQLRTVKTHSPGQGSNDVIRTGIGEDLILAGHGNDDVNASHGRNVVVGDNGHITLNPAGQWTDVGTSDSTIGGDDTILTGDALDLVFAGYGKDSVTANEGRNTVVGDNGQAVLNDSGFLTFLAATNPTDGNDDVISTGDDVDVVIGGTGSDTIDVRENRNVVIGDNGEVTFDGAGQWLDVATTATDVGGDDSIRSGNAVDLAFGGIGHDTIDLSNGDNVAAGDNAAATFNSAGQILTVTTHSPQHAGQDTITTGSGNDVVFGGTDDDTIDVANGQNVVAGDNANATFDTSGQIRTVTTSDSTHLGHDTVTSGIHDDLIFGGSGKDSVTVTDGNNIVLGDNGQADINAAGFVTRLQSLTPGTGDDDDIRTGAGQDLVIGGAFHDAIRTAAGRDLIFGDNARIEGHIDLNSQPLNSQTPDFTFTSIATQTSDNGGHDFILAGPDDDIAIGGQDGDTIVGGSGNDDLIGGHNVANGHDGNDSIEGSSGHDVIAGDNASVLRNPRATDARWKVLRGAQIHSGNGTPLVTATAQNNPNAVPLRDIVLFDHTFSTSGTVFGNDDLAGGSDSDLVFGQLGNDAIQGDGTILSVSGSRTLDVRTSLTSIDDFDGPETDGDDYIEGGGGRDLILGNLGQDDIVGGSSSMFGATIASTRPDAEDKIYGGSGTRSARNDSGDLSANGHARDADVMLGDNGNIFRLVGINGTASSNGYLNFTYDTYGTETVIPRAIQQLDYTDGQASDIGLSDEIHGESGDDIIWGMSGNDVLFGDGQDDDIIGGAGSDRIYGGTGVDGILGDDGRIFTSRNGLTETLHGLTSPNAQSIEFLPGTVIGAAHHLTRQLHKSVDLYSFHVGGHDVIYGGLGDDFIHGGAGDDASSGAEALGTHFHTILPTTSSILNYNAAERKFADYDATDALSRIDGFALNFEATDADGVKINDGVDRIFGDTGNDWIVGGTMNDRLFGGMGDDLLNADDDLSTNNGLNNVPDSTNLADADFAFGGGGYDVLIANTGADRLIDWSKRFNTYVVPIATTSAGAGAVSPTVIRDPQPVVVDFLITMAAASGADDSIDAATNETHAELGLVTVEDGQLWRDQLQQKNDRDPQPTNLTTGLDTRGSIETLPAAAIEVTESNRETVVVEGGATDSVMVALAAAPTSNVIIHVASNDTTAVLAAESTLTFTPSNWFLPQYVTLTAVDNVQHTGDHDVTVEFTIDARSDSDYRNLAMPDITVTCIDDEVAAPTLIGPVGVSSERRPTITWTSVPDATSYEIWMEQIGGSNNPIVNPTVSGSSYILMEDLGIGAYRTWVRATLSNGEQTNWARQNFQVSLAPQLADIPYRDPDRTPTISWDPIPGALQYRLYVSNLTVGGPAVIDELITET
ncbi:MAG: calcium-binding protein, partial [Fuerstiella sp.]|nr:calcium-binding protein [Fuerstiella sp.]